MIVTLMTLRTVTYAWEWNDRLRLYAYETSIFPQSNRLQILLGEELDRRGRSAEALAVLAIARELDPNYYRAWMLSAIVARNAGDLEAALCLARRAHQLEPTDASATIIAEVSAKLAATRPATRDLKSRAPESPPR
jgi:tetratricopeptide (TPR) repeat protein